MSTQKFCPALVLILAFTFFAPTASAALIVNESSTWPPIANVHTFPRTNDDVTSERDVRFTRNLAQTFQVPRIIQLDKIHIDYEEALPNKQFNIRLFTVPNVNAADPLIDPDNPAYTGTVLFNLTHTTTAGINTGEGGNNPLNVMEFDLTGADEVTLAPSTGTEGYAFQILRTGPGADVNDTLERAFKWHFNDRGTTAASIYPNGRGYAISGGGIDAGDDFLLAITQVPEPAALSLAIFVAAATLLPRRRLL